MSTLNETLRELLPSILSSNSAEAVSGTRLLEMLRPLLSKRLHRSYSDPSIRQEFSRLLKGPASFLVKLPGAHGYYMRQSSEGWQKGKAKGLEPAKVAKTQAKVPDQRKWAELIRKIWAKLAETPRETFSPPELPGLFMALTERDNRRRMWIEISSSEKIGKRPEGEFFKLLPPKKQDGTERGKLILEQTRDDQKGRFDQLASEVMTELVGLPQIDGRGFTSSIRKVLKSWREKTNQRVLTHEQQRGLIVELWFLLNVLIPKIPNISLSTAVDSWHGPKGSVKDFWLDQCVFEVKTSLSNAQKITISSPEQLDSRGIRNLFLFYVPLTEMPTQGKTLVHFINNVRERLESNKLVLDEFEKRLVSAWRDSGSPAKRYVDDDEGEYDVGYRVCEEDMKFYRVNDDFPRLTPEKLERLKVSVEKYDVELGNCPDPVKKSEIIRVLLDGSKSP